MPSIAASDRPPSEESSLLDEYDEVLVGRFVPVVLDALDVSAAAVTAAVKPKGFVVGSDAKVLPMAVT